MIGCRSRSITFVVLFVFSLVLPWLGHWMPPGASVQQVVWALLCSFLAIQILDAFFYFNGIQPISAVGNLASLVLALSAPALVAKVGVAALFGEGALQYRHIPLLIMEIAAAATLVQYFVIARIRPEKRIQIYMKVLPRESAIVMEELHAAGLGDRVHILTLPEARRRIRQGRDVDVVVISRGAVRDFRENRELLLAYSHGAAVFDWQELLQDVRRRVDTSRRDLWSYLSFAAPQTPFRRIYGRFKVMAEPVAAYLLFALLSPLLLVIALLIKIAMPGPVLFRQRRTGFRGREFELIKFRSMRMDAERDGPSWSGRTDARITRLGKLLRATHIDELPQLWNVMNGHIGFIGPRPERPEFYEKLRTEVPLFRLRTEVRPGITGWAQVQAGYAASVEESRIKLEHDLYYIQKASPQLDFIILLKTLERAVMGHGGSSFVHALPRKAELAPHEMPAEEVA